MRSNLTFEICCGSLQSALNAQEAGASRVELCSALSLGGLTPSIATVEKAREMVDIPINVLIRPRDGDFLYDSHEISIMTGDIISCAKSGADGVVIGALDRFGNVDVESCKVLVSVAKEYGLSVTFHRAIDRSCDILKAMEDAISLGVDRILTSGGKPSAYEGMEVITQMNRSAGSRVIIMPGAGINPDNIKEIVATTGVSEVHFSASVTYSSPMIFRPTGVLGADYTRSVSAVSKIEETIQAFNQ